jgi:hypothetical protein
MRERIKNVLGNECGGPNVEQIIGIGIAVAVGVALYTLASTMSTWIDNAGNTIDNIDTGTPNDDWLAS